MIDSDFQLDHKWEVQIQSIKKDLKNTLATLSLVIPLMIKVL